MAATRPTQKQYSAQKRKGTRPASKAKPVAGAPNVSSTAQISGRQAWRP